MQAGRLRSQWGHRSHRRPEAAADIPERVRDLSHRRHLDDVEQRLEEVSALPRDVLELVERFPRLLPVLTLERARARDLPALLLERDMDDPAASLLGRVRLETVHSDDRLFAGPPRPLLLLRFLLDLGTKVLVLHRGDHAPLPVDLAEDAVHRALALLLELREAVRPLVEILGKLKVAGLEEGDLLATDRQRHVVLLRSGIRFLVRVRVQGVRVVVEGALRLEGDAREVVEGLDVLERPPRGLGVEPEVWEWNLRRWPAPSTP